MVYYGWALIVCCAVRFFVCYCTFDLLYTAWKSCKQKCRQIFTPVLETSLFVWRVDYVDALGRSRRCMKKDLPDFQKMDQDFGKGWIFLAKQVFFSFLHVVVLIRLLSSIVLVTPLQKNLQWQDLIVRGHAARASEARVGARGGGGHEEASWADPLREHQRTRSFLRCLRPWWKWWTGHGVLIIEPASFSPPEARELGVGYFSFSHDEEHRRKQRETLDMLRDQVSTWFSSHWRVINDGER